MRRFIDDGKKGCFGGEEEEAFVLVGWGGEGGRSRGRSVCKGSLWESPVIFWEGSWERSGRGNLLVPLMVCLEVGFGEVKLSSNSTKWGNAKRL